MSGVAYGLGREAGRRWAVLRASALQMSRLAAAVTSGPDQLFEGRVRPENIPSDLYTLIVGQAPRRRGVEKFWRTALDESEPLIVIGDQRYAAGFIDGVLDAWLGLQDRHDPEYPFDAGR
jgi:hypothetical protein